MPTNAYLGVVPDHAGTAPARPSKAAAATRTKRVWRTSLQAALAVVLMLPGLLATPGVQEAWPWLAGIVPSAAALALIMTSEPVQRLLPSWLRTPPEQ